MNAHKFVAEHGIDEAKRVLEGAHWENIAYSNGHYYSQSCSENDVNLEELKQVVESVEIVEQLGGIKLAKSKLKVANKSGSLLLSVRTKNGMSSIYDFKVEEAIKNWELAHE